MVKIEHLKVQFNDLVVLKDINLHIKEGEVVAVIGPSGTGKSTLLRCLNYLVHPVKGKITIDGCSLEAEKANKKDIYNFRRKTAMVFQNYNLFKNMTALQNIMEPMVIVQKKNKKEAEDIAKSLLKQVGLEEKASSYPSELSGGQQQRVGIARAMASSAKVILFDEPTSSLDPELVGEVLNVIKKLAELHNTTMIIVTHEMKFAQNVADRVIFLEDGMVLSDGRPEDVIGNKSNERIRKFVNTITGD